MKKRSIVFYTFFVLFLLLSCGLMLGCGAKDSGNIEEKPTVSPPSFKMSSEYPNGGGIIFLATPDKDVTLTKIVVSLPAGLPYTIPGNNNDVFPANQTIKLFYYYGEPFPKLGGEWTFQFSGNLSPTATNKGFTVTETVNGSASAPEPTPRQ
ncbi:MAG TPA: hypothetical protein ENI58_07345 [Nitrospirae bacterium]|nr:hypothetical protein [Nitrospirota bacterium]